MTRFKKIMATVCAGVLLFSLGACAGSDAPNAATVNGVAITESKVSDYIVMIREQSGFAEDVDWAAALKSAGYTPETFRDTILDSMIEEEILRQYAAEINVTVDPAEIDSQVEATKAQYPTDEGWQTALSESGFASEDDYRAMVETSLLRTQLQEQIPSEDPTEAELQTEVDTVKANYASKRSSHILISSSAGSANEGKTDEELLAIANDLHAQLDAGADFATLAQENSADGSAANGGDVSWDCLASFVSEYQTALDALAVGEYSAPVKSQFGYHIILCTA
ncbi:MAG: peptidylprolyl isomerase, partial [Coriobacteriales bacterium]|nr:peptidylprolyl isomerase [Coriobacteriales bacterium]